VSEGRIKGYVRAEGLSMLATEAVLNGAMPLPVIWTSQRNRHFAATVGAAADLLIDLKNFLALDVRTTRDERNRCHWAPNASKTLSC
jgi:hypothetical protein